MRDLAAFCENFVSFRHFYERRSAIFQAGTLYVDQRSCELCIQVANPAAHVALAGLSRAYLAYAMSVVKGRALPSVEDGQITGGLKSVAVAVLDHSDHPVAAVAVTFRVELVDHVGLARLVSAVRAAADDLSARLHGQTRTPRHP